MSITKFKNTSREYCGWYEVLFSEETIGDDCSFIKEAVLFDCDLRYSVYNGFAQVNIKVDSQTVVDYLDKEFL